MKISLKEIMNKPIGLDKEEQIINAINKILSHKISRLLVLDSRKPLGMVSEKDILSFLFYGKRRNKIHAPITEIMHDIFFNGGITDVNEAAKFMIHHRCSSLAIGSPNVIEGLITKTDITKYFAENKKGVCKVSDHMSIHYFSVLADDTLYDVIKTMLGFEISRMIIVNRNREPIGIASTGDLFRAFVELTKLEVVNDPNTPNRKIWSKEGIIGSKPVRAIMHKGITMIRFDEDLATACKVLIDKNINALGVEDSDGKLAGVVGKRDVLLALRDEII